MGNTSLSQLIPVLQVAIGPVILISGVGMLLLTLTNRFGRAIDRARQLALEMRSAQAGDRKRLGLQIDILYQRARLIQIAVIASVASVLLVALLISLLFLATLMQLEIVKFLIAIFIASMGSLIVSLIAFIREMQLALHALKLELEHTRQE